MFLSIDRKGKNHIYNIRENTTGKKKLLIRIGHKVLAFQTSRYL
jgi:hypothetical protein